MLATRTGMGGFPEGWAPGEHYPDKWARRFAIDFVGGDLKAAAPKGIEPVITLSSGEAKQVEILYVEPLTAIVFSLTGIRLQIPPIQWRCACSCAAVATLSAKPAISVLPPAADRRKR